MVATLKLSGVCGEHKQRKVWELLSRLNIVGGILRAGVRELLLVVWKAL